MRFLITGGEGQLGRCLSDRLKVTVHEFLALGRSGLDITDAQAVKAAVKSYHPDVIINAAAYTAVDRAETEPKLAWCINAEAVDYLAEAANAVGALLIQVSTDYVFDGQSSKPYIESDLVNPLCVYGASKLEGEEAATHSQRFLIVRTAWLFSEYGTNFVKTMLSLGAEREQLSIVADQLGMPTYAGHLADGLIKMAEAGVPSGVYHFAAGKACSWFEFAEAIFRVACNLLSTYRAPELSPIASTEYPTPAQRPSFSVLSSEKLETEIGSLGDGWMSALPEVIRASLLAGH